MKIVLSGVETYNKGAELMLYAILQEIERKHPNAVVFVPRGAAARGLGYIKTQLKLKRVPCALWKRAAARLHIPGILRRLHLPYLFLLDTSIVKGAAYFLDASGFTFSDQHNPSEAGIRRWKRTLKEYRKEGAKVVFLPQAFGPAEKPNTKRLIALLNEYADIIMPRDEVSLEYLRQCNINEEKTRVFTDFTSLVKCPPPVQYERLRGAVCVIPNMRMVDKGVIAMQDYLDALAKIVKAAQSAGRKAFLLNHEGAADERLALMLKERVAGSAEVVTGLNALEVKGLISSSYLCVSSRYHGAASALNSCVPCLATSWSHKYAELFRDYGMDGCILDLSEPDEAASKARALLQSDANASVRERLKAMLPKIAEETEAMWEEVWRA